MQKRQLMSLFVDVCLKEEAIAMSTHNVQTHRHRSGTRSGMEPTGQHQHVPAWLLDLLLGVTVAMVIALVISADQGGRQAPDTVAYLFACGFGALMFVRRQFPVLVLVMSMMLLFVYYTLGYPAIGLAVPVVAALYSAAARSRIWAAIVVSSILIVVSTYFRLRDGESLAYLLGYELVSTTALMAAAIALGDGTRSRNALQAEQAQTTRLVEQEHAYHAEQRIQAERVQIARDLHDLLGHSMVAISLQANVAREVVGNNDDEVRQALAHIGAISSNTMRELRTTVKLLREGADTPLDRSLASLSDLSPLVANAAAAGLQVHAEVRGNLSTVPAVVDTAAYRIIQESLTNVIRHARASEISLAIIVDIDTLQVHIADDGQASGDVVAGSGISGMGERARLLGGVLAAQVRPLGGFEVKATLPLKDTT